MKRKIIPFNVIIQDYNSKRFIPYNIMEYLIDTWKKEKNKPKTYKELIKWVDSQSKYMYWSRCQYEIILTGWPNQDIQEKIDVYNQIMMNLGLVVHIFSVNVKFKEK